MTAPLRRLCWRRMMPALFLVFATTLEAQELRVSSTMPGEVILDGSWSGDVLRGTCDPGTTLAVGASPPFLDAPPPGDHWYDVGANIGFRVESTFEPEWGVVLVSWPHFAGVSDAADSIFDIGCVGDVGGPVVGDGDIDAYDVLCLLWDGWQTDTNSQVSLTRIDVDGTFRSAIARQNFLGVQFLSAPFLLVPGEGYMLQYSGAGLGTQGGDFLGSNDPFFTGVIVSGSSPRALLSIPYHSLYQSADEILCGQEGLDWVDVDADGQPDSCGGGIYDPASGALTSISTFDNDWSTQPETDGLWTSRSVVAYDGGLVFVGSDFALTAGQAYFANLVATHGGRVFLPPTTNAPNVALVGCP